MTIDMRDAFFDGIYNSVKSDKNVLIIVADHGSFGLSKIKRDFPDQVLNIGIAEQNMISFSAGLAKLGKIVYVYGINNFISMRVLEQVNIDLCAMKSHVNLVGTGAGFTYCADGPTHQGMQDIQAMMVLPGIAVYNVTDAINSKKLAELGYHRKGPKYFRIERGVYEDLYTDENCNFSDGLKLFLNCKKNIIISSGCMVHTALDVARRFDNIGVIDLYRTKPINEELLYSLINDSDSIITLEESTYSGGICEKIAFFMAKNQIKSKFLAIAVKDEHCFYYGDRESLHQKYSIDRESVYKRVRSFLGKTS